jgi:hypothetical protein
VAELQDPYQELGHGRGAVLPRQISRIGSSDQLVVDQREFVSDAFEALPHRYLLIGVQLVKSAGFDGVDQVGDSGIKSLEGHLHRTALFALVWYGFPELHAPIVLESVFDDKRVFPMK